MTETRPIYELPQDRDIARGIVAIVSYDFDHGWICEELQGREYEMNSESIFGDYGHTDEGRRSALLDAQRIVRARGGKLLHYYETPESVTRKHQVYKRIRPR